MVLTEETMKMYSDAVVYCNKNGKDILKFTFSCLPLRHVNIYAGTLKRSFIDVKRDDL